MNDVVSEAGVFGKGLNISWAHYFLLFIGKERTNMAAPWKAKRFFYYYFLKTNLAVYKQMVESNLISLLNILLYLTYFPFFIQAVDCVYIGAYSSDGPNLALRVARQPGRRAEVWLFLQVPGVGCLQHPVHPDTTITNADPNSFSAGGLRFDVVHPMKTWRVSFCGQLRWEHGGGHGCEQFLKENQTKDASWPENIKYV